MEQLPSVLTVACVQRAQEVEAFFVKAVDIDLQIRRPGLCGDGRTARDRSGFDRCRGACFQRSIGYKVNQDLPIQPAKSCMLEGSGCGKRNNIPVSLLKDPDAAIDYFGQHADPAVRRLTFIRCIFIIRVPVKVAAGQLPVIIQAIICRAALFHRRIVADRNGSIRSHDIEQMVLVRCILPVTAGPARSVNDDRFMIRVQVDLHFMELHAVPVSDIPEIDPAVIVPEGLPVSVGMGNFIQRTQRQVQVIQAHRFSPAQGCLLRRLHRDHVLVRNIALTIRILDIIVIR